MKRLDENIAKILLSQKQIQERVHEIGTQIAADYAEKNPLMVCLLKRSCLFFSDLVRETPIPLELDFMRASSYHDGTQTSGTVQFEIPLSRNLANRHVILVEDILDTGTTLSAVLPALQQQKPISLRICTLLDKPSRRLFPIAVDYCGFEIPDVFVVGYGLDYNETYRNLPYIGVMQ
ncbi:MAG: hypoxanthine phosphoribosyltransferase [Ruminococcus sp.]|nr:hypoxanthine phosphoribosyltransferase [Ruminococcus sp.]